MIPERLYIDNFLCYDKSYINFSEFNSAVIIGKIDNNELYSNGVGKTTIFKAIEYVLFNQADINLDKIIRDDTEFCKIVFDFTIENSLYRISRTRTKKGSSDVSFFKRNSAIDDVFTYHDVNKIPIFDIQYWQELSGRRASDTEKDICKLIKINIKSFRSTIHFMQNDFTGLTTATPEKRKAILKEALNLVVYSKLEKIAKDKASFLIKDIEKNKVILNTLGDPKIEAHNFDLQIIDLKSDIYNLKQDINKNNIVFIEKNNKINELSNKLNNIKVNFADLKIQEDKIVKDKQKNENWLKERQTRKQITSKLILELESEIKLISDNKNILEKIDFSEIDSFTLEVNKLKELITENNINIKNNTELYNELIIPMPDNTSCKHCRQNLSIEHKEFCQKQIDKEIIDCSNGTKIAKESLVILKNQIISYNNKSLELQKQKLNLVNFNSKISLLNLELVSKKESYEEHVTLCDKFIIDLTDLNNALIEVKEKIEKSSAREASIIENEIFNFKLDLRKISDNLDCLIRKQTLFQQQLAVAEFNYKEKIINLDKQNKLQLIISDLEDKYKSFPEVIQAFSSTGIPNLIIQNVLDNLQSEANILLNQLKPGLQLLFVVEKTKTDGTEADTLDIKYFVQSRERYYENLSGAMKLAVTFSLKLGLSLLLQKMLGVNIKFLLLDEIDQSLDKAAIDAFADIIKIFHNEYKILIITHNDRIKDKFCNKILVEQDVNGISSAKVVSYV